MSKRKNKDLSAFTPKLEGDGKHPKMLKGVTNEKRKEKLIPFDFDENDCDVIIEAKDKEVHLPSSFLEMVSGGRTLPMISKTDVTSERLIKVLSFYCPKISTNKLEFCNVAEVDDLFKISTTLHLKMFQDYLLEQIDVKYIESCQNFNEDLLVILNVFHKYDIQGYVRQIMIKEMILETLNHSLKPSFKTLDKKLQMEIIKNSVLKVYHSKFKSGFTDASMIFNFFELILHEDRVVDLSVKKDFLEPLKSSNVDIDLESITCPKNSPNCITLVVEEKEIHVNSFILTNNSPVFKAMLSSTHFIEGQSRRIDLPGKKLTHVACLLHHLASLCHSFNYEKDMLILSPLCQEYQIDWLTDKIKSYISTISTSKSKSLLEYLVISEKMGFNKLEEGLTNQISEPFPVLQMCVEFSKLNRRIQILIARKCLWKLLKGNKVDASIIDHALVSIFSEFEQNLLEETLSQVAIMSEINLAKITPIPYTFMKSTFRKSR